VAKPAIRNSEGHRQTDRHLPHNWAGEAPQLEATCHFVLSNCCSTILVKANDVNKKLPSMHRLLSIGKPEGGHQLESLLQLSSINPIKMVQLVVQQPDIPHFELNAQLRRA
jgi:hypothetical protein